MGGMDFTDGGMDFTDGGVDFTDGGRVWISRTGGGGGGMDFMDGGMAFADGGMDSYRPSGVCDNWEEKYGIIPL